MDSDGVGVNTKTTHLRTIIPRAALLLIIFGFGLIRWRLLSFPLERDEGEYAYMAQIMLKGLPPYQFCHTMKLPGTAATYALIMAVLGQTAEAIHLGLLIVNALTTLLMFALAKRLFGTRAGIIAAASFALLSLEPSVMGFAGHATQFVLLPALGGILLLLHAFETERRLQIFASGVLLGIAFLMKQPGICFLFFALTLSFHHAWPNPRKIILQASLLLASAFLPFALVCITLFAIGDFSTFWFWTVEYARAYGTLVDFSDAPTLLSANGLAVIQPAVPLCMAACIGLFAFVWDKTTRAQFFFLLTFLLFSFAAICPGFYFRAHYFVLLLPAVALFIAAAVSAFTRLARRFSRSYLITTFPTVLFAAGFLYSLSLEKDFFFFDPPAVSSRNVYGANPFVEAPAIATYLKNHSQASDSIAILGSEPEILFYAQRLSATGYIYMYPLMEPQPFEAIMQKQMIEDITLNRPRFMVFVSVGTSWLMRFDSDRSLIPWAQDYAHLHYKKIGVVDLVHGKAEYHWEDARDYQPQSPFTILIFERNDN